MGEIHETTQLKSQQSTYRISLMKHTNDSLYIEIVQTIYGDNNSEQLIRINPSILNELIEVLKSYQSKISPAKGVVKRYLSELKKGLIQAYYFKGASIKDLAMIFSQPEEIIEMVLRNKGIAIVSNKPPQAKYRRRKKRFL